MTIDISDGVSIPWLFFLIPMALSCSQGILFFELPLMKSARESILTSGVFFTLVSLGALLSISSGSWIKFSFYSYNRRKYRTCRRFLRISYPVADSTDRFPLPNRDGQRYHLSGTSCTSCQYNKQLSIWTRLFLAFDFLFRWRLYRPNDGRSASRSYILVLHRVLHPHAGPFAITASLV